MSSQTVLSGAGDRCSEEIRLQMFLVSWNTNQNRNYEDLKNILAQPLVCNADVIVVGLQEVHCDHSSLITALQLTTGSDHFLFAAETLGTIILTVFVKPFLVNACTDLKRSTVHLRVCNCFRTKGSVAIHFRLFGSSLLFITSHLAAGTSYRKLCKRKVELQKIHDKVNISRQSQKDAAGANRFDSVDFVFWFGDFNFRLSDSRSSIDSIVKKILTFEHLKKDEIRNLLALDQLSRYKRMTSLRDFIEPDIDFLPTYKFDPTTHVYDTSKKQRIPSYTDRIFSRSKKANSVFCRLYGSPDVTVSSDHKPVYACYEIAIPKRSPTKLSFVMPDKIMMEFYKRQRKAAVRRRKLHQKLSACGCGIF